MGFADDANALIQEKKFDDLESLWMNQIESDPKDVEAFLKAVRDEWRSHIEKEHIEKQPATGKYKGFEIAR